jgi:N-acetylglucosaminyldiphosphoundecaprenol N-acetyl-beta-D-mannosaminyltransferase
MRDSALQWILPKLYAGTRAEWMQKFAELATGRRLHLVFTPNPEQVELAQRNADFFSALQHGDIFLPDGSGLVWASKRRGGNVQQRITGRETLQQWLKQDLDTLPKTLLLGGRPDAAQKIARQVDPSGKTVRGLAGFANVSAPTASELNQVWESIEAFQPAVVFVGFGAPKQERWLVENRAALESAGTRVAMAVGGSFDVLSGFLSAPPSWVVALGLEWLYRLGQEPSRWIRQLWLIRFVLRVLSAR